MLLMLILLLLIVVGRNQSADGEISVVHYVESSFVSLAVSTGLLLRCDAKQLSICFTREFNSVCFPKVR